MAANRLANPDALVVGQELVLEVTPVGVGPDTRLVPDSELVFGRGYTEWRTADEVARWPAGIVAAHVEPVDGAMLTGADIVRRIALEYSVGPRLLLALVEAQSGWVSGEVRPGMADYPAGLVDASRAGLWWQLSWLADQLNQGYYDWTTRGTRVLSFADGTAWSGHPELNPASFAVQRVLAGQTDPRGLPAAMAAFTAAYDRLYGDPWSRAVPLPPPAFPTLQLPWSDGEAWWFTGGPHGGWVDGSAWSAVDFVPPDAAGGCFTSAHWITAAAAGVAIHGGDGVLYLDLDGDGQRATGPVLFHLHVAAEGRVADGARVQAGDRLGHPSCEGGRSGATHLHLARLYDGAWVPAAGTDALVLGGWRATGAAAAYDGTLRHADGRAREACECRTSGLNDIGR
jgi:hypothetical protein